MNAFTSTIAYCPRNVDGLFEARKSLLILTKSFIHKTHIPKMSPFISTIAYCPRNLKRLLITKKSLLILTKLLMYKTKIAKMNPFTLTISNLSTLKRSSRGSIGIC